MKRLQMILVAVLLCVVGCQSHKLKQVYAYPYFEATIDDLPPVDEIKAIAITGNVPIGTENLFLLGDRKTVETVLGYEVWAKKMIDNRQWIERLTAHFKNAERLSTPAKMCDENPATKNSGSAVGFAKVIAGNTDFALSLYGKLMGDSTENLFFSPYSISSALAMVYAGAQGQTQTQMAEVLRFTISGECLYAALGDLQKQLIQEDKSRGWQMLTANALWLQENAPFLQEFLESTAPLNAGRYQVDLGARLT